MARGLPLTFAALATEAGVSRPTVYAHFGDRTGLVSALLDRSVRRAVAAIESADPDQGPPGEALRRVLEAGWEHLASHHEIARSLAAEVPAGSVHAVHHEAVKLFERLIRRGRSEGAFRGDLPQAWIVHACLGLIHSAATAVHSGLMDSDAALSALSTSTVDLCVGRPAAGETAQPNRAAVTKP